MRHLDFALVAPKVCELASSAGAEVMAVYHAAAQTNADGPVVMRKNDESPLTLADLAANRVICAGLQALAPDIPIVSEEDETSLKHRTAEGTFWLVDPLDGTKEFIARNGEFTVNVGLVRGGEPVWGVVYAPALDLMYWGGPGLGAFRKADGQVSTLHVSEPVAAGARWRVVASKSHMNEETSRFIAALGAVELVQAGSSLKLCRVAEGAADVYPRLAPTCEWDTAAAHAVLEGAGGHVYDTRGERLRYGKADILNPHFIAATSPWRSLQ